MHVQSIVPSSYCIYKFTFYCSIYDSFTIMAECTLFPLSLPLLFYLSLPLLFIHHLLSLSPFLRHTHIQKYRPIVQLTSQLSDMNNERRKYKKRNEGINLKKKEENGKGHVVCKSLFLIRKERKHYCCCCCYCHQLAVISMSLLSPQSLSS